MPLSLDDPQVADFAKLDWAAYLINEGSYDEARELFPQRTTRSKNQFFDLFLYRGIILNDMNVAECVVNRWKLRVDLRHWRSLQLLCVAQATPDMRPLITTAFGSDIPSSNAQEFEMWYRGDRDSRNMRGYIFQRPLVYALMVLIYRYKLTRAALRLRNFVESFAIDTKEDMWILLTNHSIDSSTCAAFAVANGAMTGVSNWVDIDTSYRASLVVSLYQSRRLADWINETFQKSLPETASQIVKDHMSAESKDLSQYEKERRLYNVYIALIQDTPEVNSSAIEWVLRQPLFYRWYPRVSQRQNSTASMTRPTPAGLDLMKAYFQSRDVPVDFNLYISQDPPPLDRDSEAYTYVGSWWYRGNGAWIFEDNESRWERVNNGAPKHAAPRMTEAEYASYSADIRALETYRDFIVSFMEFFSSDGAQEPSNNAVVEMRTAFISGRDYFKLNDTDVKLLQKGTPAELAQWMKEKSDNTRRVCKDDEREPISGENIADIPFMFIHTIPVGPTVRKCFDIISLRYWVIEAKGQPVRNPMDNTMLDTLEVQQINEHFHQVLRVFKTLRELIRVSS